MQSEQAQTLHVNGNYRLMSYNTMIQFQISSYPSSSRLRQKRACSSIRRSSPPEPHRGWAWRTGSDRRHPVYRSQRLQFLGTSHSAGRRRSRHPLTGAPSGPHTFEASLPFSPITTSNSTTSPSPTDLTAFLGLFLTMAVWWTNTSSLVSFLLMNPYPDLTLNHLTVPDTLVAMTSLTGSSLM